MVTCLKSFHPADVLFHDKSIKQLVAAVPNNSPKKQQIIIHLDESVIQFFSQM